MTDIKLSTTLFGEIIVPYEEGVFQDCTLTLDEKETTFNLYLMEKSITDTLTKTVVKFLDNLPLLYQKAKAAVLSSTDSELLSYFTEFHLEELADELLPLFSVDSADEITKEMFLSALKLRGVRIGLNNQNELDCVLDLCLDEEITDELLVIYFDTQFEITDMSHES
ncbi:MAG: DUF2004 domain-containing protein [Oscillospiraceae bacterium]|nr:DUF2004 domain-containing protein [Oscillospiraceae bacterium]